MNNNTANNDPQRPYDAPPAPKQGQILIDSTGGLWKIARLTVAETPIGFYLVHLCYGPSIDSMEESMILGPREYAALIRERDLRPHLHSV